MIDAANGRREPIVAADNPSAAPGGEGAPNGSPFARLDDALAAWVRSRSTGPLARWFDRELDEDGVPKALPASRWADALGRLLAAVAERPEAWPERFDARVEGWVRASLRFSRPDGNVAFSRGPAPKAVRRLYRDWAERLSDPGFATVLDWWFPQPSRGRHAPPPLPAYGRTDRPLAVLRANWTRDGDFLAVDHREPGATSAFELFAGGRPWLSPTWASGPAGEADADDDAVGRARPTVWTSHSSADLFEWSFKAGPARVTRSALLLRGRKVALVGEQWDGPNDPGGFRLGLADGVDAFPVPESRALVLMPGRGRGSVRVYPLGLPNAPYPTPLGDLGASGGELVLRQPAPEGSRRAWRCLLFSWEPQRNRQKTDWRTLTVSRASKPCGAGVAFGARIRWGQDETLLVYRSLAAHASRAVLGHQTNARFLVGLFSTEGEVEPLARVDS